MASRRYTDEQFRTAIEDPSVLTLADLCRALDLVPRGANYEVIRQFGASRQIQVAQILLLRSLKIERATLHRAAATADSLASLCRVLGMPANASMRRRIDQALHGSGVTLPDTTPNDRGAAQRTYRDQDLLEALDHSRNYPELCRALGLSPVSTTYHRLRERAAALGRPIPPSWSRPGRRDVDGVMRLRHDLCKAQARHRAS